MTTLTGQHTALPALAALILLSALLSACQNDAIKQARINAPTMGSLPPSTPLTAGQTLQTPQLHLTVPKQSGWQQLTNQANSTYLYKLLDPDTQQRLSASVVYFTLPPQFDEQQPITHTQLGAILQQQITAEEQAQNAAAKPRFTLLGYHFTHDTQRTYPCIWIEHQHLDHAANIRAGDPIELPRQSLSLNCQHPFDPTSAFIASFTHHGKSASYPNFIAEAQQFLNNIHVPGF